MKWCGTRQAALSFKWIAAQSCREVKRWQVTSRSIMIILLQPDLSFPRSAVWHFSRLHFGVMKKFTNVRSMFAGMFKQSAQLNQISLVSSAPSFICSLCQFGHTSLCTCNKLLGSHSCKASTTQQMESQPTEITFLLCSTQKKAQKSWNNAATRKVPHLNV